MTCLHSSLLLAFSSAAVCLASAQSDPTTNPGTRLAHNLTEGTEFRYSIQIASEVTLDDEKQNYTMDVVMHFDAKVDAPAPGHPASATVSHRLTRLQAKASSAIAATEYDSDLPLKGSNSPGPAAILVGQTITTQVDSNGTIDHTGLPAEFLRQHKDLQGDDFDSLIQLYFIPLPKKPVVLGTTWESRTRLVDAGLATGRSALVKHRFEKLEQDRAYISHQFQLPSPQRDQIDFKLQESRGQTILDLVTGRVAETRILLVAQATKDIGDGQQVTGISKLEVTLRAKKGYDNKANADKAVR